jgi:hypothetical protein
MMEENFIDFFKNYTICIPAIQREYVQGYDDEKINIVRKDFIKNIFDAIIENKVLDIGIIYGYIQNEENESKPIFFPVDGQQRITTMYIIYWCLSIIKEEASDDIDIFGGKTLQYEARNSTARFFKELVNKGRCEFFKEVFLKEESFYKNIVSQKWFESQWINDVTVLAVINVISEVFQKIKDKKISGEALRNFSNVRFSLIISKNDENNARRNSSLEFAKINARGKQLELFENVKSYLNIIEEKLQIGIKESFTYNYDVKYIDLFCDACDRSDDLEEITSNINNKTMLLLINVYNLLLEKEEKKEEEKKEDLDYLSTVMKVSNGFKEEDRPFWTKYISFLNNIFQTFVELDSIEELNGFSSEIFKYDEYVDKNKHLSRLLYFDHYYNKFKVYVSKEQKDKYDYVLENLGYSSWKGYTIKEIDIFINKIAGYCDIIECFSCLKSESDLNIFTKEVLGDVNVRLREQLIKAKVIKEKDLKYNYFEELEKRSKHRSIYFLLCFSNYWDSVNDNKGSFEKLEQYLEVAKELWLINDIKTREIFALAVYYNLETGQMLDSTEINKRTNERCENKTSMKSLEDDNIHQWDNDYYFIEDNLDENKGLLRKLKLEYLKIAYDLWIAEKTSELSQSMLKEEYGDCWLYHAVKRQKPELFKRKISFLDNKLYIQLKEELKYSNESKKYNYNLNFFAYLYLLDKEKEGIDTFKFRSDVYYWYTRNVRDTTRIGNYLNFENCLSNNKSGCKKIINPFELNIIWEDEKIIWWESRDFFYYRYTLELSCGKDSLIELYEDKIREICFYKDNHYEAKLYDFQKYNKKINELIEKENEKFKELTNIFDSCHGNKYEMNDIKKVNKFILDNYKRKDSYSYNSINKYLSNDSGEIDMEAYKIF